MHNYNLFDDSILLKKAKLIFNKGDFVFKQGDPVRGLYFIKEGLINVFQVNQAGKNVFSRLVFANDTLGHRSIFIQKFYSGSAHVLSDSLEAYFFSTEEITSLLTESPYFARYLISKISNELQRTEEDRVNAKEKMAIEQVAQLLYEICIHYSEKTENGNYLFKAEITKSNLAKILLMADETVIRLMAEMRNEKILEYQDRRILILDVQKLKQMAKID